MSETNVHTPLVLKFADEYVDVKSQRSVRSATNFVELVRARMVEWTESQSDMGKQCYDFISKRLDDDNTFTVPDYLANRNSGNGLRAFGMMTDIMREHPDFMLNVTPTDNARKFNVQFL